jgi:DNA-binding NtrC family response regulator
LPVPDADYRVLVDVLREITRAADLPSAFRSTAQGVLELVAIDWMGLVLRGEKDGALTLCMSLVGRPDWMATTQPVPPPPAEVAEWLLPTSFRALAPGHLPLGARHVAWPLPRDLTAILSVPMPIGPRGSRRTQDRQVARGTLLLGRVRGEAFPAGVLPLLDAVSAQLGAVVERVEWLERFRAANAELTARVQALEKRPAAGRGPTSTREDAPIPSHRDDRRWLAADPAGREVMDLVERAAGTTIPVLLRGESGTGKELLAGALHRLSPRSGAPFVAVNVATLTAELAGSELFGHAAGAFTGAQQARKGLVEEADGGTLFLDEVGDMPATVQPALLRFLEDGMVRPVGANRVRAVDVRVVSATHRDLDGDVRQGRFRQDLFHRLAGLVVPVLPLRERPSDLRELAPHFLREGSGGRYAEVPESWWPVLSAYPWPGNVRELRNSMRAVGGLSRGPDPEARFLPAPLRDALATPGSAAPKGEFDGWTLAQVERELVRRALQRWDGHRGRVAQELGLSPRGLYDKLKRFGLDGGVP